MSINESTLELLLLGKVSREKSRRRTTWNGSGRMLKHTVATMQNQKARFEGAEALRAVLASDLIGD